MENFNLVLIGDRISACTRQKRGLHCCIIGPSAAAAAIESRIEIELSRVFLGLFSSVSWKNLITLQAQIAQLFSLCKL